MKKEIASKLPLVVPKEHSIVRLIAVVNDQEGTFPVGTIGTVVSIYNEGRAFAVEIGPFCVEISPFWNKALMHPSALEHPVVITVLAEQLAVLDLGPGSAS
jgi:hypothetical protein